MKSEQSFAEMRKAAAAEALRHAQAMLAKVSEEDGLPQAVGDPDAPWKKSCLTAYVPSWLRPRVAQYAHRRGLLIGELLRIAVGAHIDRDQSADEDELVTASMLIDLHEHLAAARRERWKKRARRSP